MTQQTSSFMVAGDHWLLGQGYISCQGAMEAANAALGGGQPELALVLCRVAYRLLDRSESYVRSSGVRAGAPALAAAL